MTILFVPQMCSGNITSPEFPVSSTSQSEFVSLQQLDTILRAALRVNLKQFQTLTPRWKKNIYIIFQKRREYHLVLNSSRGAFGVRLCKPEAPKTAPIIRFGNQSNTGALALTPTNWPPQKWDMIIWAEPCEPDQLCRFYLVVDGNSSFSSDVCCSFVKPLSFSLGSYRQALSLTKLAACRPFCLQSLEKKGDKVSNPCLDFPTDQVQADQYGNRQRTDVHWVFWLGLWGLLWFRFLSQAP